MGGDWLNQFTSGDRVPDIIITHRLRSRVLPVDEATGYHEIRRRCGNYASLGEHADDNGAAPTRTIIGTN